MKLNHMLIFFFSFLLFNACKNKSKDPDVKNLYDEVMHVHDEVMPMSMKLKKMQSKLNKIIKSNDVSLENKSKFTSQVKVLDSTYDAMMDWMEDFNEPSAETKKEDAMKYLMAELVKIRKISKATKVVHSNTELMINDLNEE